MEKIGSKVAKKAKKLGVCGMLFYDIRRITEPKNNAHYLSLVIKYFIASKGFRAVFFYRIMNQAQNRPILTKILFVLNQMLHSIEISYRAEIGPGFLIPHAQCIVIGASSIIGSNVTIEQGVTIGANIDKSEKGRRQPTIGDNVLIGAGAKILGPVSIGNNSIIGANAVVVSDIPADSIAVGIPAKVSGSVQEPYPEFLKRLKDVT